MSDYTPASDLNLSVSGARIALVASRFNAEVVEGLMAGARRVLDRYGINGDARMEVQVPGAFEIPLAAKTLVEAGRCDGVIALGAVIRGDTAHFEFVAGECARGLSRVMLDSGVPVGFGVLTCDTLQQALARADSGPGNKGEEATLAVLEMVGMLRQFRG